MEKSSFETSPFIKEVTKALSSFYTDSVNYYINSDENFLAYTPKKFKDTALHFFEQIIIVAIQNMPEFSLPWLSNIPVHSNYWERYNIKSPKQRSAIRSYFDTLVSLSLDNLENFELYYSPLYCLQWLLQNISTLKEEYGFSPKSDAKILLHFLMEFISSRSFSSIELKLFNRFWGRYLIALNTYGTKIDKMIVEIFRKFPDLPLISLDRNAMILFLKSIPTKPYFLDLFGDLFDISDKFLSVYHLYSETDKFKSTIPYNMLLDYTRDHLFYQALYNVYRTYRPNSFTVLEYINDRSNCETSPELKDYSRLFSNNFSKLLAEKDVTKIYSYNSKAKSSSNFNKSSYFKPIPEDSYYFDLLLFSLPMRRPKSSDDAFTFDEYTKNYEFRKKLQSNITNIIFNPKQHHDSYHSLCDLYFNLISHSEINAKEISSDFVKCINSCIKYLYTNSKGNHFAKVNFYHNPLATEWRYYRTVTELYDTKKQTFNEFLMTLEQIPCSDIRRDILNNKNIFYNLFINNKELFQNYSLIVDILYKVMCSILIILLKLPDSFVTSDNSMLQSTLNYIEQFFDDPYYDTIDIADYFIKPAKYKSLSNLIQIGQDLKNKN